MLLLFFQINWLVKYFALFYLWLTSVCVCICPFVKVLIKSEIDSCLVMYNSLWPMDCSLPGSSVHGILQATLEWVAILFSWGSFWPRDWTRVSCIAGRFFSPSQPPGKPKVLLYIHSFLPLPCDMAQPSTVTGKKGQTNLGSYHVSVSLSPVREHHLPMLSQWPVWWLPSCRVHARNTHQVKLTMRPSQVCNFYTIISLLRDWAAQMNHSE